MRKLLASAAEFLSIIKKRKNIVVPFLKKFKARVKKSPFLIIGLMAPLILVLGGFFWWQNSLTPVNPGQKTKTTVVIGKGENVSEIAESLKKEGLIRSTLAFKVQLLLSGTAKKIQAGSHHLSPAMSMDEIAKALTKGSADQWVTIVEGLRQEQIAALLIKSGFAINPQEWESQVKNQGLEGKLFPDSYLFPKGATQGAILKIISRNFEKKVKTDLASEITGSGLTLDQILTLASMVERESRHEEDRRIVAGILLKRWQQGWLLQTDATVQYAVANQKCQKSFNPDCDWWPQTLTKTDLQIRSPYNTYLYQALPPAPICNPGLFSIKAVLNPQPSPYWFYLSDPKGTMHYAKTDQEHAANIERYLR